MNEDKIRVRQVEHTRVPLNSFKSVLEILPRTTDAQREAIEFLKSEGIIVESKCQEIKFVETIIERKTLTQQCEATINAFTTRYGELPAMILIGSPQYYHLQQEVYMLSHHLHSNLSGYFRDHS